MTINKSAVPALALIGSVSAALMTGCSTVEQSKAGWSYSGKTGPQHWGELGPQNAMCSQGIEQSPIDIPAEAPVRTGDILFNYQPTPLAVLNNGHAIQVNYAPGSSITVEGETYNLLQFHFHALSEHTMAGQHAPMEVHFVHQSADGVYAVVGVMMNRGAASAAYEPVGSRAPGEPGQTSATHGEMINAIDMLPADRSYYRYDGSFTTPPCTEGVKWFVLATPVELSDAQLGAFEAIYHNNYRPVQPMNNRSFY